MKRPVLWLLFSLVVQLSSCGRSAEIPWRDGNFKVYALDMDFEATKLGYDHHPGLLGLVDEEVVAAGSNSKVVFVERIDPKTKEKQFYFVGKEASSDTHSGKVEGPYSEKQFQRMRADIGLPDFAWRKTKKH